MSANIEDDDRSIANRDDRRSTSARKRRVRRTPEVSRRVAIEAAKALLVEKGPTAVTLQAVAKAVGMTHGNITHHFGTRAALHCALIAAMAESVGLEARSLVARMRKGEVGADAVVDLVFDGLARGGYGRLIAWLSATGQADQLAPIMESLEKSVADFRAGEPTAVDKDNAGAGPIALNLVSHALSASLVGESLERATAMRGGSLRRLAARQLESMRAKAQ
ncbi:MAG: helix-turn-helix domain-containing protein [Roseiarcus sp.]|jgi:AcrR family transcriptional regulator